MVPWASGNAVLGRLLNAAVLEITKHGGEGPFRIDAGVVGIRGARWVMPRLERLLYAASGETRRTTTEVTAETATQHRYLASLFNRLTDMFGFDNEIPPAQVPAIMIG